MWQRIKTAIVLVIIVGFALFASSMPIFVLPLLAAGVLIAAHEWTKLMPKVKYPARFILAVLLLTILSVFVPWTWVAWWAVSLGIWVMATAWVLQYPAQEKWYGKRLVYMGAVILTAAITAMYGLWQMSPWWLMYVFLLVWCADSGAYFVGRKLGKRKLAPNVSPNKSIEGLIGGLVTAGIVTVIVGNYLQLSGTALALFLLLSAVTVLASVLGDLFESMLKRRAGIKDSGSILPGHGGVLDRIDSLLSATPVFAFGFWLLLKLGVFTEVWIKMHFAAMRIPF
ncbi:phosphatidate cytidylyltransferase [Moraxella sp. FZLJ2107]|uniref:phosphatidate cytidylyltransferase n=1 Tax=unclassified Moraxella TaxID=2685852 RepID=UPI0020C91EA5|nr:MULTISPECIES: phosphatidate cytidylyltransferase [unclassified Moraxella]UTO05166.1 phosphatidate cytidylyltransferase [Moraxella sp. FZLJ2107]UTO21901.1 phosphatidate cytidylyltransferase [Moraxella sp. FZLJ2109]